MIIQSPHLKVERKLALKEPRTSGETSRLSLNLSPESLGPTRLLPALSKLPDLDSRGRREKDCDEKFSSDFLNAQKSDNDSPVFVNTPHCETETSFSSIPSNPRKSSSFDVFECQATVATEVTENEMSSDGDFSSSQNDPKNKGNIETV